LHLSAAEDRRAAGRLEPDPRRRCSPAFGLRPLERFPVQAAPAPGAPASRPPSFPARRRIPRRWRAPPLLRALSRCRHHAPSSRVRTIEAPAVTAVLGNPRHIAHRVHAQLARYRGVPRTAHLPSYSRRRIALALAAAAAAARGVCRSATSSALTCAHALAHPRMTSGRRSISPRTPPGARELAPGPGWPAWRHCSIVVDPYHARLSWTKAAPRWCDRACYKHRPARDRRLARTLPFQQ